MVATLAVAVVGLLVSGMTFWRSRPGRVYHDHQPTSASLLVEEKCDDGDRK